MKKSKSYIRNISMALIVFATARKLFQQLKTLKKSTKSRKEVSNEEEKE